MLVLFETPAGFALFKLLKEKKLKEVDNLHQCFETADGAKKIVQLQFFKEFKDITEALAATTATIEGKVCKTLKKLLKSAYVEEIHDELAVADAKLGSAIKDKFNIKCVYDSKIQELMRCIRGQADNLLSLDLKPMALGLGHSLARYKLKFNPDKVDIMVIQAIGSLDDIDREINNYVMRAKEWYSWHFPELTKIVSDNQLYVKTVYKLGMRSNLGTCDLSDILPEEVQQDVKNQSELSIGCDIEEGDVAQIKLWCEQVLQLMDERVDIFDYVTNRMRALAPNLSAILGEIPAARILARAGSLTKMAKLPASTIQILGAEKALFKAMKTKHDTPKYGLIYHSQLVQQANQKSKGKMARTVAAKAALATRVDALGDSDNIDIGLEARAQLERKVKYWNEGCARKLAGSGKSNANLDTYTNKSFVVTHEDAADSTLSRKRKNSNEDDQPSKKKKKLQ